MQVLIGPRGCLRSISGGYVFSFFFEDFCGTGLTGKLSEIELSDKAGGGHSEQELTAIHRALLETW